MALVMGLVFGGLRVADAVGSADAFGRVSQLASLAQQVTILAQDLQNERDETTGLIPISDITTADNTLRPLYDTTNAQAAAVKSLAAGIGGSFPANIQSRVAALVTDINNLATLRSTIQVSQSPLAAISGYATPIGDMLSLTGLISEGTSDSQLTSDVQTLSALSQAKEDASQQRALLFNAFEAQNFVDGVLQTVTTAQAEQAAELTAFNETATPAEQEAFTSTVSGSQVNLAEDIGQFVVSTALPSISGAGAFNISATQAPAVWFSSMSTTVNDMETVELGIAGNIVGRAHTLQAGAESSALLTAVLTLVVLLIIALATLLVARSLVLPLRRLRAGALQIATVQLPDRVRRLGEAMDPAASLEVAPIDVSSADEIGQVARAFDQVHAEAVRLAGNEAMMRNSFNAMFVNLSRRSQVLIERLARMIDSLEQTEEDPDRLSNLFSMDHLVTRMRRNSENLLLLAGHENTRKWAESVALADVARASTSEIEQYARVTLSIQPGVAVSGQAVSDVVHLLAELIENATTFSPKDSPVQVSAQELTSGGVLIEVSDRGVGISESRLEEMNWRLDHPPVMDVSVSRHMGLFAVGRLAQRHGVRVRLRIGSPSGLTALVWLPETVIERTGNTLTGWTHPAGRVLAGVGQRGGTEQHRPAAEQHRPAAEQHRPAADQWSGAAEQWSGGADQRGGSPEQRGGSPEQRGGAQPAANGSPWNTPWEESPAPSRRATNRSAWFRTSTAASQPAGSAEPIPSQPQVPQSPIPQSPIPQSPIPQSPGPQSPVVGVGWSGGNAWTEAAQITADPVHGDQTSAGLPLRVPRANLIPGSARGASGKGAGRGHHQDNSHDSYTGPPPAASRSPRSPDVARSRLSGFQRGTRRASGNRPAGEGADR